MLTLRQIKSAIETKISSAFPGTTVHKTGVQNGFSRPSFYVRLDSLTVEDQLFIRMRTISVEIHYFPADRYQHTLELLDVQDVLESTFGLNLNIEDRTVTLDQKSAIVVDGVLHFSFDFTYYEDTSQPETGDLMEELHYE